MTFNAVDFLIAAAAATTKQISEFLIFVLISFVRLLNCVTTDNHLEHSALGHNYTIIVLSMCSIKLRLFPLFA